jgi:hypothetical protein
VCSSENGLRIDQRSSTEVAAVFLQADDVREVTKLGVLTSNDAGGLFESGQWVEYCCHDGRSKKGSEDDFGCHDEG